MAGGGVAPTTSTSEKSPSAGTTAINAALFNQLGAPSQQQARTQAASPQQQYYQPTQQYYQPTQQYYQAQRAPQQQYAQPQVQQSMQAAYNPFRSQASQTLSMPGFQGVANPFYSAPRAQTSQPQNNLLAQYDAYRQQQAASIQAGKAAQLEQAKRLQQAYADAQAAKKAQAEADKARAEAELRAGDSSSYAAAGGIADLQRGFK